MELVCSERHVFMGSSLLVFSVMGTFLVTFGLSNNRPVIRAFDRLPWFWAEVGIVAKNNFSSKSNVTLRLFYSIKSKNYHLMKLL